MNERLDRNPITRDRLLRNARKVMKAAKVLADALHAPTHAADGTDPITPEAIEAAAAVHAANHATGHPDAITPADIGAAAAGDQPAAHRESHSIGHDDALAPADIGAIPAGSEIPIGDQSADGSWKILISGTDLVFQRRISGTWTTKQTIVGT